MLQILSFDVANDIFTYCVFFANLLFILHATLIQCCSGKFLLGVGRLALGMFYFVDVACNTGNIVVGNFLSPSNG
jgi:hypothetical protein